MNVFLCGVVSIVILMGRWLLPRSNPYLKLSVMYDKILGYECYV